MTAAGEAVLATAYGEVGAPDGSKYWAWYGADLGSYCACFVSWSHETAGFPICAIDSAKGFVLVSNGTYHGYMGGEMLPDMEPGDTVLFSWYNWEYVNGMPLITDEEYYGWVAGDHTGVFAYWIDRNTGQFAAVEGNTNGGVVAERTDRYAYQVCGYWRPPIISSGGDGSYLPPTSEDEDEDYEMMRYIVRAEDGSAYAVDGIKAYPMASAYTVSVLQATGALMTREQMSAKGWTVDVDGGSINAAYEIQPITEHTPDSM